MNKLLITAGILLTLIWLSITLISYGVPVTVCNFLKTISLGTLGGAIDNMQNGFFYDVPNANMPTVIFLILFSVAFLLYFIVIVKIQKVNLDKKTFFIVVAFAIIFRAILLPSVAIHENDFYRYLWDGKSLSVGVNPFKHAPEEVEEVFGNSKELLSLESLREKNPIFFNRIGHKSVPTIYPPIAQFVFALSSVIKQDSILLMKSIFVIFDIFTIMIIALLLMHFNKSPSLSIVYAWSPLVLKEIVNSGHYDSIAIFFMLLAIYLILKNKVFLGGINFAIAACSKFFPFLLIPIFFKRIKLRNLIVILGLIILLYTPFFIMENTGVAAVFKGMKIYSQEWSYNGSVFAIIYSIFDKLNLRLNNDLFLPKLFTGILFIAGLVYISLRKENRPMALLHKSFIVLALLFLLNPVGDPWYFCWVIPFLCFFPYRSFIVLSWLLIFSYLSFNHDFGLALNAIQYVPFFVALILELALKRKYKFSYV